MDEIGTFLRYLTSERRLSEHTVRNYRIDLEQFSAFLAEHYETDRLSVAGTLQIRSWLAEMKSEGVSSRTLHRKRSSLATFFKYAQRRQWTDQNPVRKTAAPKVEKRLPSYLQEKDMQKLLNEVLVETNEFHSERDRLMLVLFYETGIRLSELIGIKIDAIDSTKCLLRVLGKRNKERMIPLRKETASALDRFSRMRSEKRGSADGFLFCTDRGAKLYPSFVYRRVNDYLQQVSTLDKRSPHILRHTFATHMLNNGAQLNTVKELLGHANLSATQVYTHNTIEKLKGIHERNHPKG